MAAVVASGLASLHDLKTVYDSEDFYTLVEILSVCNWNMAHMPAQESPQTWPKL
ncbi:hypothetical protein [Acetobacter ascendens]|uniref:hypothetical protein n=1 Tax=Acetobacter ascendens TaxID=481146 RepID=UPI000A6356B0|nr:hypothetical protein [Acetobacter ascendens]